jgi:hypothetical protein
MYILPDNNYAGAVKLMIGELTNKSFTMKDIPTIDKYLRERETELKKSGEKVILEYDSSELTLHDKCLLTIIANLMLS